MRYNHVKSTTVNENEYQPQELKGKVVEENHNSQNNYPKIIPMMLSKQTLKCRKIPLVLQYHVPNKERYPEEYTNPVLFTCLPFRDEEVLRYNNINSNKFNRSSVVEVFTSNRTKVEPYATIVEDSFE